MGEVPKYKIERPIYSYENFSNDYVEEEKPFDILKTLSYKSRLQQLTFPMVLYYIMPFPFIMASFYKFRFIFNDIISGITMLVFHIPQGMAFGLLTGVQPINGLYASFFPPLTYFLFGTSRHISLGTFSIMSLLSSVPVMREARRPVNNSLAINGTMPQIMSYEMVKLQIAIATALLAGIIQIIMGLCQLGCIMNYVNITLIGGFTTATAFHIIFSQLGSLLGYSVRRYSGVGELPYKFYLFVSNIRDIHPVTFSLSISCMLILLLFTLFINPIVKKKFDIPIPIQLILVIIGTIISYYLSLGSKYSVKIVGTIPKGFPKPMVPDIKIWPKITLDAIALAIFAFVMNSSLAKIYALEFSYDVNFNQELVAYGLANMVGSFFQCIPTSAAMTRTAVVVDVGMKSQVMWFAIYFHSTIFLFIICRICKMSIWRPKRTKNMAPLVKKQTQ